MNTIAVESDVKEESILNAEIKEEIKFSHFPVLDGVRGIAVLIVMLYHLEYLLPEWHSVLKGGFLGVDVFFVMSGFLITSILIKEHSKTGNINLKNFYLRRFLRLAPALWFFLIIICLFGYTILPFYQAELLYKNNNFIYAALYLMNWHQVINRVETGNLNHTWSLAIEEQFYIIWSLALFAFFYVKESRRKITFFTAFLVLGLIIWRGVRVYNGADSTELYYSTETRIDALLIGCLAAMAYNWQILPRKFFESNNYNLFTFFAFLTATAIIFLYSHNDAALYYGALSVFAFSVAIILIWLISFPKPTIFHNCLEFKPLRWIGQISYGLYLWHYASYEFSKMTFENTYLQVILGITIAFSISSFSYYLVEKPFLKTKLKYSD